jgi:hypothetical protein
MNLPLIRTDDTDQKSGNRDIGEKRRTTAEQCG